MTHHLTLIGDRQAGKTHLLTVMAVQQAAQGDSVLYCSPNTHADRHNFHNCAEYAEWLHKDKLQKTYRTNGAQRIVFSGGGVIRFTYRYDPAQKWDLVCLDDVAEEVVVNAERVIRAVLR